MTRHSNKTAASGLRNAFRILEAYVAGDSPAQWHMDRFVLAGVSALALYSALRILLAPLPAGVTALLFFSGSQNPSGSPSVPTNPMRLPWSSAASLGLLCSCNDVTGGQSHCSRASFVFVAGFVKETFMPILPGTLVFIYGLLPLIVSGAGSLRTQLRAVDTLTLVALVGGVGVHAALILVTLRHMATRIPRSLLPEA